MLSRGRQGEGKGVLEGIIVPLPSVAYATATLIHPLTLTRSPQPAVSGVACL